MFNLTLCPDAIPNLLGFFDTTIAPALLYYSYIPIVLVSVFLSLFVFLKDKYSLLSKLLLAIALSFSLWVFAAIVEWIAVDVEVVHFFWQIISIFEVSTFLFSIYFVYVFLNKKDLEFWGKLILSAVFLSVVIALPTTLNMASFDVAECQANNGSLWFYIYIFEISSIVVMMFMFYNKFRSLAKGDPFRKQIAILASGVFLFLGMFTLTNIFGDSTLLYEVNLLGPIGMVVFIGLMTFMIVRFKAFNIKLLSAQALVWTLAVLIGSQLFFIKVIINYYLTGVTFIAAIIFGYFLTRSVKKEVAQREELAKLNLDLKKLLKQRESLMHLINHKVKGSFTRSKYIFAEMIEGTFGRLSPKVMSIAEQGLNSDNEGIATIDTVLNMANLQAGLVKYDMQPVDFRKIVEEIMEIKRGPAEAKNLKMAADIKEGNYTITGDQFWLKEVALNLVDNAVKYTDAGLITVGLEPKENKILFFVKDTGGGITDEDKKNLYTEGGRGKDSLKKNVNSTGYGLSSVKLNVEAHHGRVWEESVVGQGSTFYVELPL